MDSVLKVGLAGVGSVSRTILSNIETIPGVQLTGIADIRQEALDTVGKKYGVDTFTSVEAMCESANVDAVWVCTPNQFHAEHTITAAEHGKHVICEKPMAVTLEQAQSMVDAVDRNSVRYVQGHSKIFDPPVRMMRETVSSGELGRPHPVEHLGVQAVDLRSAEAGHRGGPGYGRRRALPARAAPDRHRPGHRRRHGEEPPGDCGQVESRLPAGRGRLHGVPRVRGRDRRDDGVQRLRLLRYHGDDLGHRRGRPAARGARA